MSTQTAESPSRLELSNQNMSCTNHIHSLDNNPNTLPTNGIPMSDKESFCCAEYRTRSIRSIPRKESKEKRTERRRFHHGEKLTTKTNKMEVKGRFTIIDLSPESPEQVTMRKHIHINDYDEETKTGSELSHYNKRRDSPTFQNESSLPVSNLSKSVYSTVCAEKSPPSYSGRQYYRETERQGAVSRQSGVWESTPINNRRSFTRRKEAPSRSGKYTLDSYASTAESSDFQYPTVGESCGTPSLRPVPSTCVPTDAFVGTHLDLLQAECIDMKRVLESMISANAACLDRLGLSRPSRPSGNTITRQSVSLASNLAQGCDWRLKHESLRLAHNVLQAKYEKTKFTKQQLCRRVDTLESYLQEESAKREALEMQLQCLQKDSGTEQFSTTHDSGGMMTHSEECECDKRIGIPEHNGTVHYDMGELSSSGHEHTKSLRCFPVTRRERYTDTSESEIDTHRRFRFLSIDAARSCRKELVGVNTNYCSNQINH
uniref:AlNc14C322G10605 protein n=1 Tax=Albugo laibachii Nc14 TaxID=890382 RepID=F0WWJ4_9STRA|nr:AlNc14C322G10605 [Albugo laibachii Nc14]|eukprot:CCA25817.1 AlNc14C322G10605 [Albugo laibachii Nc14]